MPFQFKFS